jgi:hypothetical protein
MCCRPSLGFVSLLLALAQVRGESMRKEVAAVENTTRTAAFLSYCNAAATRTTPPFGTPGATGLSAVAVTGLQPAGMVAVAAANQRPRIAKLGRPPRGQLC